ncbi:P-loop containing nucleoside triphosphate hydrolase protein [Lipomyces kononenkoae]
MARLKRVATSNDYSESSDNASDGSGALIKDEESMHAAKRLRPDANNASSEQESGLEEQSGYDDGVDSEDEAFDQLNVTQEFDADVIATAGIIKSVELVNFMCHKFLKIDFGPQINFVIGHNGSGKSAILTAITICLGAKASVTNRASSLKSLIKEGCNSSSITVIIKNEGEGFKPEKYGPEIWIERVIQLNGSTSYRIKNHKGVQISKDKEELTSMLDFFGLMVDNPVTLLSQDTARTFLSNSTPEEKYGLFMKGIRLDSLRNDYDAFHLYVEKTIATVKTRREALNELQARRDEAAELYKKTQNHRQVRDTLTRLQGQFAWATVVDSEKALAVHDGNMEIMAQEVQEAERVVQEATANYEKSREKFAETQQELHDFHARLEPLAEEITSLRRQMQEKRDFVRDAKNDERNMATAIEALRKKLAGSDQKIAEERQRLSDLDGGRRAKLAEDHTNCQNRLQQLKMDLERAIVEGRKTQNDADKHKGDVETAKTKFNNKQLELNDIKSRIGRLQAHQQKYMTVFGQNIDSVLKAIERESRFVQKPVGPIGSLIRMKQPEWGPILEAYFNRTLDSFAVTCKEDEELLKSILSQYRFRANIIIRKDERFNFSQNCPDSKFQTVLDCLEFEHEYVKYIMIDVHNIERVILIADRKEADRVMYTNPRNVTFCFAKGAGHPLDGYRLTNKRGASGMQPQRGRREPPRMKTDSDMQMRSLAAEEQHVQDQLNNLQAEWSVLDNMSIDFRRREQSIATKMSHLKADIQNTESEIDRLAVLMSAADETSRLNALEESRDIVHDELVNLENVQYPNIIMEKDRRFMEMNAATCELEAKKTELEQANQELAKRQKQVEDATEESIQLNSAVTYRRKQYEERRGKLEKILAERERLVANLEEVTKLTRSIYPKRIEIEDGKTADQFKAEMIQVQQSYQTSIRSLPKPVEQIIEDHNMAQRAYNDAARELTNLTVLMNKLNETYLERRDRYYIFRNQICTRAKDIFRHTLDERGFKGRLFISHENETLNLKVEPVDTGKSNGDNGKRNVTTLSGGEKSYTQICLLMSLWDAMNCPLRGLDEFDVFMDAVNRRISLKMMIQTAQRSSQTQTIFITPQDMGNIKLGDDVKIIRMADPERAAFN